LQSITLAMSKSNGWSISADWGATSTLLTIKHTVKHSFFPKQNGQKNTIIYQGWGAEK
jgi:hypothetical protein